MDTYSRTQEWLIGKAQRIFKTDVRYLVSGGFWVTVSQAIYVGTGFLLSVVFANFLAPTVYGIYKYVTSVYALFNVSTLTGINTSYSQSVARSHEGDFWNVLKTKISFGFIGSLCSFVLAIYYFYNANTELGTSFTLIGIFVPFVDSLSLYDSFFQGRRRFDLATKYLLMEQVVSTCAMVVTILFFTPSVVTLVAVYLMSWTGVRGLLMLRMVKTLPPNTQTEASTIYYGIHLTAINIIPLIGQYIDRILVFHFLGPVSLAGYNFATIIPDQIKSYFKNLQGLATPKMSVTDPARVRQGVLKKTWMLMGVLLLAMLAYILLAPYFFALLFSKYTDSVDYSQIYSLSIIFTGAVLPMLALQTQQMKAALYKYNIVRSLFQIASLSLLLWWLGLWGIIIARIVNDLFALLIGLFYVHKMR